MERDNPPSLKVVMCRTGWSRRLPAGTPVLLGMSKYRKLSHVVCRCDYHMVHERPVLLVGRMRVVGLAG